MLCINKMFPENRFEKGIGLRLMRYLMTIGTFTKMTKTLYLFPYIIGAERQKLRGMLSSVMMKKRKSIHLNQNLILTLI